MWIIMSWQCSSPELIVKGFKKSCISSDIINWMGLVKICCGMTVKRMGMLGVSVMMMKVLDVKMETVTLIGKGRYNLTCFVHLVYESNCIFS
jgi:hypothetical protein